MNDLLQAVLFTGMVATAGLGISSLIMMLLPATTEGETKEARGERLVEYAFFGISGVVSALVLLLAMNLS
ncbi:hypothetical protein CWE15_01465 [Aliidiomarina taiwanensis]|uniref:Uncharacterized protein n=1 Tax=Aliidiomarina taiwanensis TaxID=946228 RepID=A0A432X924_9GAMM|nr:hypothetical protein [Aliidiomarina taiwanensis]RUO43888.1 hypothetical protein CWE15_01465 [Aliidiomarina taiwanensis]